MSSQKSVPLTKEEVMKLVELVEAHQVLTSKGTNATNNQLKEATWVKVANTFNALVASHPRKPEQLRLKWENLKKAARKRNAKIRMNNLKTGGGKPEYIPPDDALDKVAAILGPTCNGYSVKFGGDAEVEVVDNVVVANYNLIEVEDPDPTVIQFDDKVVSPSPVSLPAQSPLDTPTSSNKFFFSSSSKGKMQRKAISDNVKASVISRNRAIAEYYDAKKKQEEDIAMLKKKKLELEIELLKKNTTPNLFDKSN